MAPPFLATHSITARRVAQANISSNKSPASSHIAHGWNKEFRLSIYKRTVQFFYYIFTIFKRLHLYLASKKYCNASQYLLEMLNIFHHNAISGSSSRWLFALQRLWMRPGSSPPLCHWAQRWNSRRSFELQAAKDPQVMPGNLGEHGRIAFMTDLSKH